MSDLRKRLELISEYANIILIQSKSIDSINDEEQAYIDFTMNTLIISPVGAILSSPLLNALSDKDAEDIMRFMHEIRRLMNVMRSLIPELNDDHFEDVFHDEHSEEEPI